jgi:hypothetical protein
VANRPPWREVLPREGAAVVGYRFQAGRFAVLSNPVLVLFGDQSPPWRRQAMEALDAALPNSRLHALAGQGHLATHTAPELLAAEILAFLDDALGTLGTRLLFVTGSHWRYRRILQGLSRGAAEDSLNIRGVVCSTSRACNWLKFKM